MARRTSVRHSPLLDARGVERLTHGAITARRAWELAAQDAFPAGVVLRLGRSVRFSRLRLEAWLGLEQAPMKQRNGVGS